jgi:hypothetical protein
LYARPQHLKEVEGADPQFFKRARIGEAQRHQRDEKREANHSRDADLLRPSGYPFHCQPYPHQTGIILCSPTRQGEEGSPDPSCGARAGPRRIMPAQGCYFSRKARMS